MRENCDFFVPINILTPFARAPFSWSTRHTTVCLDRLIIVFAKNSACRVCNCQAYNGKIMKWWINLCRKEFTCRRETGNNEFSWSGHTSHCQLVSKGKKAWLSQFFFFFFFFCSWHAYWDHDIVAIWLEWLQQSKWHYNCLCRVQNNRRPLANF